MNARPFVIGCVLAVGTCGTAVAAGVKSDGRMVIIGGASESTAGYENTVGHPSAGSARTPDTGGDVRGATPARDTSTAPSSANGPDDNPNGGSSTPDRSNGIGWQSLLPGSIQ